MSETPLGKVGANLVLLGTIHHDEEGPVVLSRWLEALKPDVVTLEFSLYGIQFRREHGQALRQRVVAVAERMRSEGRPPSRAALHQALAFADMPYEYKVASDYCQALGRPIYPVDLDIFSLSRLRKVPEFFDEGNLRRVLGEEDGHGDREKTMARLFFTKGIKDGSYTEEMHLRDRYMSARVAALMRYHAGASFLHITGWRHLEDPRGVYDALNPFKVFFHDATLCI
jgi:hypothetical protein